jgi:hypothetical protein
VKSIESEKEDNSTAYERDISLQQAVGLFSVHHGAAAFLA